MQVTMTTRPKDVISSHFIISSEHPSMDYDAFDNTTRIVL